MTTKPLRSTYPVGHLLNPATRYVPAAQTDIRATFERVQRDRSGPDYRTVEQYWQDLQSDRRFREKFGHLLDMLKGDEDLDEQCDPLDPSTWSSERFDKDI